MIPAQLVCKVNTFFSHSKGKTLFLLKISKKEIKVRVIRRYRHVIGELEVVF